MDSHQPFMHFFDRLHRWSDQFRLTLREISLYVRMETAIPEYCRMISFGDCAFVRYPLAFFFDSKRGFRK